MEGDRFRAMRDPTEKSFQSTPSAWRETTEQLDRCDECTISIHSLRMEGDFAGRLRPVDPEIFQSTPSAWRETCCKMALWVYVVFQSTPSAWRETAIGTTGTTSPGNFNPLPPHGGRRIESSSKCISMVFQSTPSAWRETSETLLCATSGDFNPLPPHGGRLSLRYYTWYYLLFQSTPSAWRETLHIKIYTWHQ